jgi:hypothetical protein
MAQDDAGDESRPRRRDHQMPPDVVSQRAVEVLRRK